MSNESESEEGIELGRIIESYCRNVDDELKVRLEAWSPNFTHIHVHEVLGGALARQATLSKEIARAPTMWTGHSAPILLRAMADVHINIAWLLRDPLERCRKFILFGLGQAKLELEHRRAEIGSREPTPQEVAIFEAREGWIDSQRTRWMLDVDLGKWSGLSVRQMAEEAECIDFYNYVYAPFSGCAHSMWHHIALFDLKECPNVLHRYHRLPISEAHDPEIEYLIFSAEIWNKTLLKFDEAYKLKSPGSSSYEALIKIIYDSAIDPIER